MLSKQWIQHNQIGMPLALALPSSYALAPAVVVTQTLIELAGMVVLTRLVPGWSCPTPQRSPRLQRRATT